MMVSVNPGDEKSEEAVRTPLRERKKQRTRAAIQEAALRLFAEQGYNATTCEQIAEAADVSPATFFRYFPTKDDVVLTDDYDPLLLQALSERPADETPIEAVRNSLGAGLRQIYSTDAPSIRARTELILSVPSLRARMYEAQREAEALLAAHIAPRMGGAPEDLRVRVVTTAIASAMFIAVEAWILEDGDLPSLMDGALAALEQEFAAGPRRAEPKAGVRGPAAKSKGKAKKGHGRK